MKSFHLFIFSFLIYGSTYGQSQHEGYELVFEENFESYQAISHFRMTDDKAWQIIETPNGKVLELSQQSQYSPRFRSPFNIAMVNSPEVGSFIMEIDLQQTGREYGHRDLCLFFGAQNPENFYYTHIASVPDPHAHNIFLVNNEERKAIATKINNGIDWGTTDSWHHIKIIRDLESGSIEVYFDDMEQPIMVASDLHFGFGKIGLGSFDDTGRYDNLKIWTKKNEEAPKPFF